MTAIRCPAPWVSCQTRGRSVRSACWLRPGPESAVIVVQTSRCTVGHGGAGKAGLGSNLSSICGGETACADGVPSWDSAVSTDTAAKRATRDVFT